MGAPALTSDAVFPVPGLPHTKTPAALGLPCIAG